MNERCVLFEWLAGLCFLLLTTLLTAQRCQMCRADLDALSAKGDTIGLKACVDLLQTQYPDSFFCLGRANVTLGLAMYRTGQLNRAVHFFEIALAYRKKTVPPIPSSIARNCNNLGFLSEQLMEYKKAGHYYEEGIKYAEQLQDDPIITYLFQNLANVKIDIGDYQAAHEHYRLAVGKCYALRDTLRMGEALMGFGNLLNQMGLYEQAIDTLENSITLFRLLKKEGRKVDDRLAGCYNNMGIARLHTKDFGRAIDFFRQALAIQTDLEERLDLMNNMGACFRRMKKYDQARRILQQGIRLALRHNKHNVVARCYDNLGEVELDRKNYPEAIANYHKAVAGTIRELAATGYRTNPAMKQVAGSACSKELLVTYLTDKAKGWMAWYRARREPQYLDYAVQTIMVADTVVDLMRREHSMEGSKLFWREKSRPYYEMALEAAFLAGDVQSAFYFFEKSKSVLLLDALTALQARRSLDNNMAAKEIRLQRRLADARKKLQDAMGTPNEEPAREALLQAHRHLDDFIEKLADQHPANYQLRFDLPEINLVKTRSDLIASDGGALIHYFLGDRDLYALSVVRDADPVFLKIPIEEVDTLLSGFFSSLRDPDDYAAYTSAAFRLYQKIYAPLLPYPDIRSVIIVPDGRLAFVPFDALVATAQPSAFAQPTDFVLSRHLIRYAYSASVLTLQEKLNHQPRSILAFAPGFSDGNRGFAPLNKSREAMAALCYKQCKKMEGSAATKKQFLSLAGSFGILYLFTHASAHNPRIEFADSTLFLSELKASTLDANLVILAACETGIGEIKKGEGVLNMASGFAYAGAASLISSLWKVPEAPTEKIFSRFFHLLSMGADKASALRQAKLDYLTQALDAERTPYHWAAFVYFGQNGTTPLRPLSFWDRYGPWLLLPVAGLVALAFWRKRRKI